MNHTALHIALAAPPEPLPWDVDLTGRGIVLLRAQNAGEALAYARSYELMLAFIDLRGPALDEARLDATCALLSELAALPREGNPLWLLGIEGAPTTAAQRERLVAAGLCDLLRADDPPALLVARIELLRMLRDLQQFQRMRMEVGVLAQKTREGLHDLSQPLSALQGRLQLMAVKCPADDPQAKVLQDLVRLIFQVSQHVVEIQQLHRTVSG